MEQVRASSGPSAPPSLFTAIEEQLSLKLQPVRREVAILIVGSADRVSVGELIKRLPAKSR
jgi:uncharacterized protein (TIGR03435 family)